MVTIKIISNSIRSVNNCPPPVFWNECVFISDARCRDYDWLLVYDDMPRVNVGTVLNECEPLACPREQTILITAEPPSIKIYNSSYTRQFGYILTTHDPCDLPHPGHRVGRGCLQWMAGYPLEEALSMPDYPKSKLISTVCSSKQQRHTQHYRRFKLTKYLTEQLPSLDWYGWGVKNLDFKYHALNPYKYHIAGENYINPHHWTDKISDPILGLCLTFYAGDPNLGNILPPESFIPISLNEPEESLHIIQTAIENNEYERRLPAIREARRLIVEKYNLYQQVVDLIHEHQIKNPHTSPTPNVGTPFLLKGRHTLRRNPINLLRSGWETTRYTLKEIHQKFLSFKIL